MEQNSYHLPVGTPAPDPGIEQTSRLQILLEDGPVVAVNKPSGLLTQGVPRGIPTLESQVKEYLKKRYGKPGNVYLGIPHRLDRPVSGVVVFARNSKAAQRLAEQFQQRQVRKTYWAVVERVPYPPEGTLTDSLLKVQDQACSQVVSPDTPGARPCNLQYRTIGKARFGNLVEIELGTGRMHQIRVQFASRGWPVMGDFQYNATCSMLPTRSPDPLREPIALHARCLTFLHPVRYEPVTVIAPLPPEWDPLEIEVFTPEG